MKSDRLKAGGFNPKYGNELELDSNVVGGIRAARQGHPYIEKRDQALRDDAGTVEERLQKQALADDRQRMVSRSTAGLGTYVARYESAPPPPA